MTNKDRMTSDERNTSEMGDSVDGRKTGWLYFVQCGEFVKIGKARDLSKRLSQLQVGNPAELRLLLALPGTSEWVTENEQMFHHHMRLRHVRGEWFRCSLDDLFRRVWTISTRASNLGRAMQRWSRERQPPGLEHGAIVSREFAAAIVRVARDAAASFAADQGGATP